MDKTLEKCPFCGETKLLEISVNEHKNRRPYVRSIYTADVICLVCLGQASTRGFCDTAEEARQEAIKSWNRRA